MNYNHRLRNAKQEGDETRHLINQLIRRFCCWNCFQIGHLRFQCPFPRAIRCSFCRRPYVLSTNCNCRYQNHSNALQPRKRSKRDHQRKFSLSNSKIKQNYDQDVIVPMHASNGEMHPVKVDNIVVFVNRDNEETFNKDENEDMDILEIHAEDESLENI